MEIKYIWITEYGVLKRFGVNFNHSGPHRFEYQGDRLELRSNEPAPLKFSENVLGVSAIVGQNGAGKSTLCQALLSSLATVSNGVMGWNTYFKGVVCFGENIYYQEDLVISNLAELSGDGYTVRSYKESPLEGMPYEDRQSYIKNGFIYYSNQFDPRGYFEEVALENISTAALVYDDGRYSTFFLRQYETNLNRQVSTEISHFSLQEYHRMGKFICFCYDFLPMPAPEFLLIRNTFSGNNKFLIEWEEMLGKKEIPYFGILRNAEDLIFNMLTPKHQPDDAEISYTEVSILDIQYRLYRLNVAKILLGDEFKLPSTENFQRYLFDEASSAVIGVQNPAAIDELLKTYLSLLQESIPRQGVFRPGYFRNRTREFLDWRFYVIEFVKLPNNEKTRGLLRHLVSAESELLNASLVAHERASARIVSLGFPTALSSGEYSFLALFSRLYELFDRFRAMQQVPERVALFIDEAEVGFHPAWSKRLFQWILKFLKQYGADMRFQLILTTHSPYLLSDLPAENVILMKRNAEGVPEVVDSGKFLTFGGNVYDLLADAFFLQDGAIGEFAREEIQRMIDALLHWRGRQQSLGSNDRQTFEADGQRLSKIIPIIADGLIRGKLLELYNEVFGSSDATARRIRDLEDEIANLKRRQP